MKIPATHGRKPTRALQATAYHEAGHAVAAFLFNVPFRKKGATIISDGNTSGGVHTKNIFRDKPDVNDSDAVRLRCERKAMVSLAGTIAQRKFNNRSIRNYHGTSDRDSAIDLMSYFFQSSVLEANLKFLIAQVEKLIRASPLCLAMRGSCGRGVASEEGTERCRAKAGNSERDSSADGVEATA